MNMSKGSLLYAGQGKGSGVRSPTFEPLSQSASVVCPWVNYFTSLCLVSPSTKRERAVPAALACWENPQFIHVRQLGQRLALEDPQTLSSNKTEIYSFPPVETNHPQLTVLNLFAWVQPPNPRVPDLSAQAEPRPALGGARGGPLARSAGCRPPPASAGILGATRPPRLPLCARRAPGTAILHATFPPRRAATVQSLSRPHILDAQLKWP